jgi:hypothetical protein
VKQKQIQTRELKALQRLSDHLFEPSRRNTVPELGLQLQLKPLINRQTKEKAQKEPEKKKKPAQRIDKQTDHVFERLAFILASLSQFHVLTLDISAF